MLLWFGHGCTGNCMLSKHERYYSLYMDVQVEPYALGTRTLLWFGHGCTGNRMLSKHESYCGLGMDGQVTVCYRNTTLLRFGHGCTGNRMLSSNTNVIMVWACLHW